MPASRSARAMILAPRSCPSRPGFATTTRILRLLTRREVTPGALPADATGAARLLAAGAAVHRNAQQEHERAQEEQRAGVAARARQRGSAVALGRLRAGRVAARRVAAARRISGARVGRVASALRGLHDDRAV